jgi:hypothetical protein
MYSTNRAPILHRLGYYLQMGQIEIPHDPHHLGVPSGASKTLFEDVTRSAQTVHLSSNKISTIFERTESSFHLSLNTKEYHRCIQNDFWDYSMFSANYSSILHRHQHYFQMDQNEIRHDPCHLGVPSGASKMISKVVLHSAQTVHLSCVKMSTISELTESSFHLSLVT